MVNDEIKFGDNDTLGALVANLVDADALIILTDQKASTPPIHAKTLPPSSFTKRVPVTRCWKYGSGAGSSIGRGA